MKKIFILIIAVHLLSIANAQINVTTSDMPVPGEILPFQTTMSVNGIDIALTGTNYLWDYSSLLSLTQSADTFVTVTSTPLTYIFTFSNPLDQPHFATVASPQPSFSLMSFLTFTDVYNFYKNSTGSYSQVGFGARINGIPLPIKYDNAELFYNLPVTMNDLDSSLSSYNLNLPNFGYYGQTIKRVNLVDGWGTLYLPHDTFSVIRVKSEILTHDTIHIDTLGIGMAFDTDETEYRYLTTGHHIPVLQITKRNGLGGTTTIKYFDNYVSLVEENKDENDYDVFPNPATNSINIHTSKFTNYHLSLINMQGKEVYSSKNNKQSAQTIDISGFSKGIYILKMSSEKSLFNKKIIIE